MITLTLTPTSVTTSFAWFDLGLYDMTCHLKPSTDGVKVPTSLTIPLSNIRVICFGMSAKTGVFRLELQFIHGLLTYLLIDEKIEDYKCAGVMHKIVAQLKGNSPDQTMSFQECNPKHKGHTFVFQAQFSQPNQNVTVFCQQPI